MRVQLLYLDDCPAYESVLARPGTLLSEAGIDVSPVPPDDWVITALEAGR